MAAAQVTTGTVEAPTSYAQDVGMVFDGAGSVSQQPYFKPVARRDLMAAVNATAKDLGIGPTSVVVLDALLSCLPCNDPKTGTDAWISPQTLLTVFACNDTLCFRAKGITDRQLRAIFVASKKYNSSGAATAQMESASLSKEMARSLPLLGSTCRRYWSAPTKSKHWPSQNATSGMSYEA